MHKRRSHLKVKRVKRPQNKMRSSLTQKPKKLKRSLNFKDSRY